MPVYQCQLINGTRKRLRVTVVSWYAIRIYHLNPDECVQVEWYAGDKSITAFDTKTRERVSLMPVTVSGSMSVLIEEVAPTTAEGLQVALAY